MRRTKEVLLAIALGLGCACLAGCAANGPPSCVTPGGMSVYGHAEQEIGLDECELWARQEARSLEALSNIGLEAKVRGLLVWADMAKAEREARYDGD